MADDDALLGDYAQSGSEDAFAELVRRHLDLVYSTALRAVNADQDLAKDVCQTVFIDLSRKAASLAKRSGLTGWLYKSACFAAAKAVRSESRRQAREQQAHAMQEQITSTSEYADWDNIRPVFDSVMLELKEWTRCVHCGQHLRRCKYGWHIFNSESDSYDQSKNDPYRGGPRS